MEALAVCARRHPIVGLAGTNLAMHSQRPGWEAGVLLARKSNASSSPETADVWQQTHLRQ